MNRMKNNKKPQFASGVLPGIGPSELKEVHCSNCNGSLFIRASSLLFASKFQSTTGNSTLVENPLGFLCISCGKLNSYDIPELQQKPQDLNPKVQDSVKN